MPSSPADPPVDLRLLLGSKLRTLRADARRSLKDVAARAGVSISYLSEIEQGKKYPKPERLVDIARALGADYNALVSLHPTPRAAGRQGGAGPYRLPLPGTDVFDPARALDLVPGASEHPEVFARALRELAATHGLGLAEVLEAALHVYRAAHRNTFPEIERAADTFREHTSLPDSPHALVPRLRRHLADHYGYTFDETTLARHPVLSGFRSVLAPGGAVGAALGGAPRLYLNSRMVLGQRAFLLAREVGFNRLAVGERATTSPAGPAADFEVLRNTLHGSVFAGALVLPRARVRAATEGLFGMDRWRDEAFLGSVRAFGVTPEIYFHRLAQLLPGAFGLPDVFLTCAATDDADRHRLPSVNLTGRRIAPPPGEHACRRWGAAALLREPAQNGAEYTARAQVVHFVGPRSAAEATGPETYFTVSVAYASALDRTQRTAVTLGIRLDERFSEAARFVRDPSLPHLEAGLSCERCPLSAEVCTVRAAPPVRLAAEAAEAAQQTALAALVAER